MRVPRVAQELVSHEDLKSNFPLPEIPAWLRREAVNLDGPLPEDD